MAYDNESRRGGAPTVITTIRQAVSCTNRSSTITVGGTSQTLMAANPARIGWEIWNLSSEVLWVNKIGGAAAADTIGSFPINPYGYYCDPAVHGCTESAITIVGFTTGSKFTSFEW